MSWPTVELQELALQQKGAIVSGPFGSNIGSRFFVEQGVPVIRGNNLTKGDRKFIDDGFVYLTDSKAAEFPNCIAISDDIVFTAAGSIGQVGLIPIDARYERYVISNKQMRVRLDREKAEPLFVYYWLSSNRMTRYLEGMNNGGAVPLLNLGIIRRVPIPHPKLEIQKQIASILSAYDDLIENNQLRIQLLEQAARLLYKEWFVHLRFPGHEHVKIKGGIPEKWEDTFFPDVVAVNPKTPIEKGKEVWYVPMSALSESGMTANISDFELRTKHTNVKFRKNDVLLARITPCLENGKTGLVYFLHDDEVACGSTEFIVLRGKHVSHAFTYCLARSYPFRENAIKSMIGSSGRQRVQVSCFQEYKVPLPPKHLLEMFDDIANESFEEIRVLMAQNNRLVKARDLLLPRLMNGEIAA
jgi:type I restriction enzyme S subunit